MEFAKRMVIGEIAGKVLDEAINLYLQSLEIKCDALKLKLDTRLRARYGIEHWAGLDVDEAVKSIKEVIGDMNVWEYTYKPNY